MDVLRDFLQGEPPPYLFLWTYIGIMTAWRVLFMLGDALNLFINVFLILMKFSFFNGDFSKKRFNGWLSELNSQLLEGSKKQDCVPLEVDSIQEHINYEDHQNKSMNTEQSCDSKEQEIQIEVAEVNAYYNVVSSNQRGETRYQLLKTTASVQSFLYSLRL